MWQKKDLTSFNATRRILYKRAWRPLPLQMTANKHPDADILSSSRSMHVRVVAGHALKSGITSRKVWSFLQIFGGGLCDSLWRGLCAK